MVLADRHPLQDGASLPVVTLITPTFDDAQILPETINSVLAQQYPRIEYIVIDDESSDGTWNVLNGYGDLFHWERQPHAGQAHAVNRGLALAHGEFIGIVKADDPLPPGAIAPVIEALLSEPDAVLAFPDWELIQDQLGFTTPEQSPDYSVADIVRWHQPAPGSGLIYRREVVQRAGGWDPTFSDLADYDFFLRALLLGSFRKVPLVHEAWRQYERSSETRHWGIQVAREHIQVIENLYAREDLPETLRDLRTEALRNAYVAAGITVKPSLIRQEMRFQVIDHLTELHHDLERRKRLVARSYLTVIERLHDEIRERDKEIAWLQEVSTEQEKGIAWMRGTVAEQQKTINWLNENLAEQDKGIGWLHGVVAEKDKEIVWLRQQLAERDREISALHRAIAEFDRGDRSLEVGATSDEVSHIELVETETS